jgi:hypothetical protein
VHFIEEEEYLDDRKWMGLLGQVDWPRSNFEYFIKVFNSTAVIELIGWKKVWLSLTAER